MLVSTVADLARRLRLCLSHIEHSVYAVTGWTVKCSKHGLQKSRTFAVPGSPEMRICVLCADDDFPEFKIADPVVSVDPPCYSCGEPVDAEEICPQCFKHACLICTNARGICYECIFKEDNDGPKPNKSERGS